VAKPTASVIGEDGNKKVLARSRTNFATAEIKTTFRFSQADTAMRL
jgi:hypothetical protein